MGAECLTLEATPAAREIIARVRKERGDDLTFVFDGGCCEATAPYLYDRYLVDPARVCIGEVDGIKGYMPAWLVELFKAPVRLTIDIMQQPAHDSFSAEVDLGYRFVLRQEKVATSS